MLSFLSKRLVTNSVKYTRATDTFTVSWTVSFQQRAPGTLQTKQILFRADYCYLKGMTG